MVLKGGFGPKCGFSLKLADGKAVKDLIIHKLKDYILFFPGEIFYQRSGDERVDLNIPHPEKPKSEKDRVSVLCM